MYSIFVKKRPIKTVFLINPEQSDWKEQIDAIWKFNQEKWGGRYNPIVPTNGESIDENWLEFLEHFDADYFISTCPIRHELSESVKSRFSPIDVELPRAVGGSDTKPIVSTFNKSVSVYPDASNMRKFAKLFSNNLLASIVGNDWQSKEYVYRFLLRNFGIFPDSLPFESILNDVEEKEKIVPSETSNLVDFLTTLSTPAKNYVFPIQFSMFGNPEWYIKLENGHSYDDFGIIIGNGFNEQIFLRNKVFYERDFSKNRLSHIWLSETLSEDYEFMQSLGRWIRTFAQSVQLFSFSVGLEKLEEIGSSLIDKDEFLVPIRISTTVFDSFPFPTYEPYKRYDQFWERILPGLAVPKDCDLIRANSFRESIELQSPDLVDGKKTCGSWIGEIYVENDKNKYSKNKYYLNQPLWWQLPRKNHLAGKLFKEKGRINSNGIPCIQYSGVAPILKIELPNESDLIASCILANRENSALVDSKIKEFAIHQVKPSNIGKYLTGFIAVFGGLTSAHSYLSERYWRIMFDILSGKDLRKDNNLARKVKNKLRKKINNNLTKTDIINNFENLSDYVIQLSREIALDRKKLEFADFLEEAKHEHVEFQSEDKERKNWNLNESRLTDEISSLLRFGVLQMGFSQKCPKCGTRNWYLIDSAKQFLVCNGCSFNFSMPANPQLSYKLSNLAKQGVFSHGLTPVVLVLGQILEDSPSSFFFAPSMDLFRLASDKELDYEKITDADIVCIQDGRLIVGEVKHNQSLFTINQMMTLAGVAESIKADVLLFSSLNEAPNSKTLEMVDKIKQRLKDTNVDVGWYQLDNEIFKPTPKY